MISDVLIFGSAMIAGFGVALLKSNRIRLALLAMLLLAPVIFFIVASVLNGGLADSSVFLLGVGILSLGVSSYVVLVLLIVAAYWCGRQIGQGLT